MWNSSSYFSEMHLFLHVVFCLGARLSPYVQGPVEGAGPPEPNLGPQPSLLSTSPPHVDQTGLELTTRATVDSKAHKPSARLQVLQAPTEAELPRNSLPGKSTPTDTR